MKKILNRDKIIQKDNQENLLINLFEKKLSSYLQREVKNSCFYYSGKVTMTNLSEFFKERMSQIATFFWEKGITNLNTNQPLSPPLINLYCQTKGITTSIQKKISFNELINKYLQNVDANSNLSSRSPIVIVMGHIDHGKTTLLDTICDTKRQRKEKGGITQKISVHQANFQEKKITFLDTPGHHIFLEMRQRGISLADLAVLVIAADDGIMPQTKEIIQYIIKSKIPVIIFINHKNPQITDNEKNLVRIKTQIQEEGIALEEWGGDTLIVSGNAKNKENTNFLLENINLLSDISEWKVNLNRSADGIILDSTINPRLGIINNLLIQGGQLSPKDLILVKGKLGKIKLIFDNYGKNVTKALPSNFVQVTGLPFLAEIGEKFLAVEEETGKQIAKQIERYKAELNDSNFNQISIESNHQQDNQMNIIALAESQDSLEALIKIVESNSNSDFLLRIVYASFGNFNEFLLNLTKTTQSFLLIFNLKLNRITEEQLKQNQVEYFQSGIIYKIEDKLKEMVKNKSRKEKIEKILGTLEVKKTFYFSKTGIIAGCKVVEGVVNQNHQVKVLRKGEILFTSQIKNLESEKVKVNEVKKGQECGIVLKKDFDFQIEDKIISYRLE